MPAGGGYEGGICLKVHYEQHCNIFRAWRGRSEDADMMEQLMGGIKPFCSPGNRPWFFKLKTADRYSIFAVSVPKSSRCQIIHSGLFEVLCDFLNFLVNVSSSLNSLLSQHTTWQWIGSLVWKGLFPSMTISTCQHRLAHTRTAYCLRNGGLTDSDGSFRLLAIWPRFHRTSKSVRFSLLL